MGRPCRSAEAFDRVDCQFLYAALVDKVAAQMPITEVKKGEFFRAEDNVSA